ncbi:MAG: hypothetical protein VR64_17135 [Desulfatitalea sp. BRH_c12]|nr:MAG: hypothetical protein VR64_17135 [Desulfatitalea sp. BRH_c12]
MNDYQQEQWDALLKARLGLTRLSSVDIDALMVAIDIYMAFRHQVDDFQSVHFTDQCTRSCFENHRSACCSKDGIVTFWGDVVINTLLSSTAQGSTLDHCLSVPAYADKCTYLGPQGCQWQVRPLMCAMFVCDPVKASVLLPGNDAQRRWEQLQERAKQFRWPDQPEPVLFDRLETCFLKIGIQSSLMYINQSPGLLSIKRKSGCAEQGLPFRL